MAFNTQHELSTRHLVQKVDCIVTYVIPTQPDCPVKDMPEKHRLIHTTELA